MIGVNVCTFVGQIARYRGIAYTKTGKAVLAFWLEIPSRKRDGTETATKVEVTAWDKYAVSLEQWVRDGLTVLVQGRLSVRRYQKDGAWVTEVSVSATNVSDLGQGGPARDPESAQDAARQATSGEAVDDPLPELP
jgi:single-stranded DNA-binding protein